MFLIVAAPAWPRVAVVFRLASAPVPVQAGQEFALCAVIKHGVFHGAAAATASVQVTATMTNGRDTPIEVVR